MSEGYKDDKFSMGRRDHFVTIGDYDSATAPEFFKESLRNQGYNRNDGDHLHKDKELAFTMKHVNYEKEFNHGLGISREQIHTIRHKLRAAAYDKNGMNLSKEFERTASRLYEMTIVQAV